MAVAGAEVWREQPLPAMRPKAGRGEGKDDLVAHPSAEPIGRQPQALVMQFLGRGGRRMELRRQGTTSTP